MKEIYLAGFEIDHHKTDDDANYIAVEDAGEQSFLIHVLSDLVNQHWFAEDDRYSSFAWRRNKSRA